MGPRPLQVAAAAEAPQLREPWARKRTGRRRRRLLLFGAVAMAPQPCRQRGICSLCLGPSSWERLFVCVLLCVKF